MFDRQQSVRRARVADLSSTDVTVTEPTRALYIGGTGGNLIVELVDDPSGTTTTYVVAAYSRHDLRVRKIVKSGTTATPIVMEW